MIRLTKIFAAVALLALLTGGCQSKTKFGSRTTTDYSVVSEGSANGVTSTITSPGETAPPLTTPPLTGTNADTTTNFTISDTALQQMPANVGPDGTPVAPPPGTYQPTPTYVPPPPVRTTIPPPATSTGTITIHRPAQQPRPPQTMPPEPAPTETTGTAAPTDTTDTTTTQPEEPKKKKVKPPEQPTQTDTTDTVGTSTETDTIGHQ